MPSADAIAWMVGANENINKPNTSTKPSPPKPKPEELNFEVHKPHPPPISSNKPSIRPNALNFEVHKPHPPPTTQPKPTAHPDLSTEIRRLVAQGIPPEKAAQIIAEKYGIRAEVYKVQLPSLVQIEKLRQEHARKAIEKFEKKYELFRFDVPFIGTVSFSPHTIGEWTNKRTELEYQLSQERDLGKRLRLATEWALYAFPTMGINAPIKAFTGKTLEQIPQLKPIFKIGAEYNKMLENASKWFEEKAKFLIGTPKEREFIYQTIIGEGTISKTPRPEIAKPGVEAEEVTKRIFRAPVDVAATPTFFYTAATKPAETAWAIGYEIKTKPFAFLTSLAATGLLTSGLGTGFRFAKAKIGAKLGEFKPQYTVVEFGKELAKVEPYTKRPINIGFIGEFSKEELPILKKVYEQPGATIDYLQKSLGIGKKELQSRLKLMQSKDLVKIVNNRVFLNKNKFRNIPIGTIKEYKPIWASIAVATKEKGVEFKGAKPIAATVVESAFKIGETLKITSEQLGGLVKIAEKQTEGTAIAKVRPRLGFELQIPGVDKIRVTTIYKNLLGKKAMIASEFTEEGAKIVAKKGEESTGFGFKILEKSPIITQELTENPPIVISSGGRIARAWISREEKGGKEFEFEIGKELKEISKPFDLGLKQKRVQKSVLEEFNPIETKSGQMLLTAKEVSEAETVTRQTKISETKSIPIFDISKEVKALENMITESKPMVGFTPTTPLVVPPAFSIALPQIGSPTFTVPTISVETELVKPKIGTELFTPALNIGIQPMVGLKPEIDLAPAITTLPSLGIGIKPFTEMKPFTVPIEITTPKVEPLVETKPMVKPITRVEPITTPKVSTKPFTSFKPISVPIPSIGIPSVGVPIISIPTPNIGFNFGFGIPSFVMGKPSKKKGKKRYIGLLAGYTEVTLTELLTGHKAHHLMVPAKMAKFWKETLASGGLIEVPTFEEIIGKNKKRKKRWVL